MHVVVPYIYLRLFVPQIQNFLLVENEVKMLLVPSFQKKNAIHFLV